MTDRVREPSDAPRVADVTAYLRELAALDLAESWDNVGLLLGFTDQPVNRVMTCLTLTRDVVREAVERGATLIVSHHPILFRPVQRLTGETEEGRVLLALVKSGISVYSAHTAYDSSSGGINAQLADALALEDVRALRPLPAAERAEPGLNETIGAGRIGRLVPPQPLADFLGDVKTRLGLKTVDWVGESGRRIERVGIACGSGGEFLDDAVARGCDVLITGEARFHTCVEAQDREIALVLIGHFASEYPAMKRLAEQIHAKFPALEAWCSTVEADPIQRA